MKGTAIRALLLFVGMVGPVFAQSTDAVDIDGGFSYRDLEFAVLYPNEVLGTMINNSGKDYKYICFLMKLYNKSDALMKTVNFCLSDFQEWTIEGVSHEHPDEPGCA